MISLVTGAAGSLGSQLARALVARGDRVRAFDLAHAAWHRVDGAERVVGDIELFALAMDALAVSAGAGRVVSRQSSGETRRGERKLMVLLLMTED